MRIPKGTYLFETTVDTGRLAGVVRGRQVVVIRGRRPMPLTRLATFLIAGLALVIGTRLLVRSLVSS